MIRWLALKETPNNCELLHDDFPQRKKIILYVKRLWAQAYFPFLCRSKIVHVFLHLLN